VGFLSRCAAEWMDGSQSAVGCTLPALLKWGWQRAASLKSRADNLCKCMDSKANLSAKWGCFLLLLFVPV
jgi:hypothetical protein